MAKFNGKYLTGTAGPTVYKRYRNMQLVTAKSRLSKETQTENTKRAAAQFGVSSRLTVDLRKNFENIVTDFYDGKMVYRFKTLVQQSLKQALDRDVGNYQFTTNSDCFWKSHSHSQLTIHSTLIQILV